MRKISFLTFGVWIFIAFFAVSYTQSLEWSWLQITCPIWIGAILDILFFVIIQAINSVDKDKS